MTTATSWAAAIAPLAQVERQAFLNAMSQFANSVCIVATDGEAGRDGMCVSSMTSVAADGEKPTLLICLNEKSRVTTKVLTNGRFSVNLLTASEQTIADLFAGRCGGVAAGWFDDPRWMVGEAGLPVLNPSLASFECSVYKTTFVGTHHIIIGAVDAVYTTQEGSPLIHSQRLYRYLA